MNKLIFIISMIVTTQVYSQTLKRCPSEWKGEIQIKNKTQKELYSKVLTWALLKISPSEPYTAQEDIGVFKVRTKLPYHIKEGQFYMLYDLSILVTDNKISYSMKNCYVRRKPLEFWLEKYPPGDNVFDNVFSEISINMDKVIAELTTAVTAI